jgi:dihydrofolate synthase/folylpolyglutamate synthase
MDSKILDFIYKLGEFQIRLGLESTEKLMQVLGNPHHHPRIIHIAGTNGKGSSIAFLEKLLLESGFSVCTATSPHFLSYRERFRFQAQAISEVEFAEVFWEVCARCSIKLEEPPEKWLVQPTFFEFSIGLAFYWFQKKTPDYILLETGMGGRLDASNVVEKSLVCGFTPISFDHSEFLGNSLEKIAREKFGIIKEGAIIVSARQKKNVKKILQKQFKNPEKIFLDQDFFIEKKNNKPFFRAKIKGKTIAFSWNSLQLAGDHQLENAALALAIYYNATPESRWMKTEKISASLSSTRWGGRLQYLKKASPTILLEAAHNADGIEVLGKYLAQKHCNQKILFVVHWLKKKQIIEQLKNWDLKHIQFLPVDFSHPKANDCKQIYQSLRAISDKVFHPLRLQEIIQNYNQQKFTNYDLILVAGSIYLLGDFCANLIKSNHLFSSKDFYGI